MPRRTEGFSLLEMVVAVAIMAILAGAALPLLMKSINQQAEQTTRSNAQYAYNAVFGLRDHRVSNMIADFGYVPVAGNDLRDMLTMPATTVPWQMAPNLFSYGWNGPYWVGSTTTVAGGVVVPADAWGHPYVFQNNGGLWQVVSAGDDGNIATAADNIGYPSAGAVMATCTLSINVINNRAGAITGTYTMVDRNGGVLRTQSDLAAPFTVPAPGTLTLGPGGQVIVNPGPVSITVNITSAPAVSYTQVVDILPGQTYSYTYPIN